MFSIKTWITAISYIIMFASILMIIPLGLFPCFFSGFLTYEIIVSLSTYFERFIGTYRARQLSILIIIIILISTIAISISNCTNFFSENTNKINMLNEINHIFSDFKKKLPNFLPKFFPNTTSELKERIFSWIELNIILIRNMGHVILHGCITLLIGLIIGAMIAYPQYKKKYIESNTYFTNQLLERIYNLSHAFHNIVFAQLKISSINTLLTSIMIFILIPVFGETLPLGKTLIIITFVLGLLPIVGNLISNIMITISALSISLSIGITMLIYLILIHKLEYFLNAEIIGNKINSHTWELVLAMIFLESIFGLEGLIAAPIFYAYLKIELQLKNII
ncbi:putative transmembrane protein [Candidatus Blochmanniella vafra str. BVAF]|uniref:Transmembrane protein n=1 Tax=Blochmanniella vafra (strain BVAF) TaxID=859654 RepID=E8Q5W3_BLOVB|nr:AI-2E family transporter [Candidatus Blochmannia vafer]ADV33432.1 putative transmembrane protein [Candidatus Blochmannia vafer str. BVAF]